MGRIQRKQENLRRQQTRANIMCIIKLRDDNLLARIKSGVTIYNKLFQLCRYVKLKSLQHRLFKCKVTILLYIDLHEIDTQVAIAKGIKHRHNIISTVNREIVLIVIKNLWAVDNPIIIYQ